MPTYTYHCENCDHEFDQYQSFSDAALKTCPVCKEKALYKVYKPAQVVFKGSGYYVTDSHSRSSTLDSGSNGSGESSSESKDSGKASSEKKAEGKKKPKKPAKSESTSTSSD